VRTFFISCCLAASCSGPAANTEQPPATNRGDASVATAAPTDAAPPDTAGRDAEVWDHIAELGDEHFSGRAIAWLAARPERARPALYEVIDQRGRAHYTNRALRVLAAIGDPVDVPKIASLLDDPDKSLQWHAVIALSNHPTESALIVLTAAIEATHEDVATEAMAAIARRKHEAARPALERALNREQPGIRGSAAWTLYLLGAEPSRAALEARLTIEKDKAVRKEIKKALAAPP
jgi:HEAT repeat protein